MSYTLDRCSRCKGLNDLAPNRKNCSKCRAYGRVHNSQLYKSGLCTVCGGANDRFPRIKCTSCRQKEILAMSKIVELNPNYWKDVNKHRKLTATDRYYYDKLRAYRKVAKDKPIACVVCHIEDIRILEINHKNNDGVKDWYAGGTRRGYIRATKFYQDIIHGRRGVDDLEIRCSNHNIIYEHEKGRRNPPEWFLQMMLPKELEAS